VKGFLLSRPGRIETLDSVRGVAAFIVVIHHCFLTRPVYSDYFFSRWQTPAIGAVSSIFLHTPARIVWSGYEAVTLFYVLSGLVLALPWVVGRAPDYKSFAIKRLCRLYLPYVAAIAIAGIANFALLHRGYVPGASKWVNEMTWTHAVTLPVIFDHLALIGHHATINGVTHTLIWEIRVSLLVPLLIAPILRWRIRGALAVLACLFTIIVSMQLLCGNMGALGDLLLLTPHQNLIHRLAFEVQWTAYYSCFFVLGMVLATRLNSIRLFFARNGSWFSFPLLFSGVLVFQGHWSHWHVVQESMVAVGSVLLLCAALSPGMMETMLLKRAPRYLGKISFSLYLVHVPVILALTILTRGALSLPVLIAIVVPVSILFAIPFDRAVTIPSVTLGHWLAEGTMDTRRTLQPMEPAPVFEEEHV
jgi:peptidoglycan/LPS O-acetylase OafA/YrhL